MVLAYREKRDGILQEYAASKSVHLSRLAHRCYAMLVCRRRVIQGSSNQTWEHCIIICNLIIQTRSLLRENPWAVPLFLSLMAQRYGVRDAATRWPKVSQIRTSRASATNLFVNHLCIRGRAVADGVEEEEEEASIQCDLTRWVKSARWSLGSPATSFPFRSLVWRFI